MKKNLGRGYHVLSFTVIFSFAMLVSPGSAKGPNALAIESSILDVTYDPMKDLLSIHARQASLDKVLQEIAKKTQLSIDSMNKDLLREDISVEIKMLSLEQALKKLLKGFNTVMLFSSTIDTEGRIKVPHVVRVIVLSKQANISPQFVQEAVKETESAKTVETSLTILTGQDVRAYDGAIAALKDLSPEETVSALTHWLQRDDQQRRVAAATALGHLGDERAIGPLSAALTRDDPATRLVAATSMARIGGDMAVVSLLQAYRTGDTGIKYAVATAIAAYGDGNARKALANLADVSHFTPSPRQ